MKNNNPKVSIIIPVYNGAKHLKETIDSILNQSFKDYEIIIVDDASTDNSVKIIKSYGDQVKSIRHTENKGAPAFTKNTGIKEARGDLIAFSDHDDIWLPKKLETQVDLFDKYPKLIANFTNGYIFDDAKSETLAERWSKVEELPSKESIMGRMINENFILTTTAAVVKRDILQKNGGFDEKMKLADDYDLWLRLASFGPVALIAKPLFKWRFHPISLSNSEDKLLIDLRYFYQKVRKTLPLTSQQKKVVDQKIIVYGTRLGNYYLSKREYSLAKELYREILEVSDNKSVKSLLLLTNICPPLAAWLITLKRKYSKKASRAKWTLAENL